MVKPSTHSKYDSLKRLSEFLATVWGMGHLFFVVFLTLALVVPLGIVMMLIVDSDMSKDRAWDVAASSATVSILMAAIGFGVRQFAAKKGKV